MKRKVVIDLLALHKDKGYGFQQYILNLLDFFYYHRNEILYEEIIIVCKNTEIDLLSRYTDKFVVRGFFIWNYLHRLLIQTLLPFKLELTKTDLLISPGNTSGLVKRCPEILVIHDLLFKRKAWINRWMRWQREIYIPISIKKANILIAISHFTADDISNYYPQGSNKIVVIYNFMNFEKFNDVEEAEIEEPFFLAVSMSAVFKNQQLLLSAFKRYFENGGEKKLVLIGILSSSSVAGKTLASLPEKVKKRIIIKSHISNKELGGLYKNASCFISASLFEGLGMPVVEAMSFNCPVLLSDTAVHREVSQNKGVYFNPYDELDLTNNMLNMSFRKQNYSNNIKNTFSEANTSAKYVELINSMYRNC